MLIFNQGDVLECVDDRTVKYLTKGKRYQVLRQPRVGDSGVTIRRDDGHEGWYHAWRFVSTGESAAQPETSGLTQAVRDGATQQAPAGPTGSLPDSNPKTRFGMAKPPLSLIPGAARVHLAEAFRDGAQKYGPANWRVDPVSASTYLNAAERHLVSWQDGEEVASDSGVHHLAHAAACLLILLDAQASGTLQDDRPTPTVTGELIREKTRPLA